MTSKKASDSLIYLYGVTRESVEERSLPPGVDGKGHVSILPCEAFFCVTSAVDAQEFGADLSRNMENLEWLAAASVRHQQVVAAMHERTLILPARFATLFRSLQSLAEDVRGRRAELASNFESLADADEYGVKIFAVPAATATVVGAASGKEYLRKKSELAQSSKIKISAEVRQFAESLERTATRTSEGGRVGSGQRNLVWHASLLVQRPQRKQLERLLKEATSKLGERYRVECTGPWPPYSFVTAAASAGGRG